MSNSTIKSLFAKRRTWPEGTVSRCAVALVQQSMGGLQEAGVGHGELETSLRPPSGAVQWPVRYMSIVER